MDQLTADAEEPVLTIFDLRDRPDVARWLLSFVDVRLAKLGKLAGERRLGKLPGGDVLDALIRGNVMLAGRRPDGGPAFRLNPDLSIWLRVNVRLPNRPAYMLQTQLNKDPEFSRWLLLRYIGPGEPVEELPVSEATLTALREHGVLVDEPPPDEACLPDPDIAPELAEELSIASQIYVQKSGQDVPSAVREVLGGYTPVLPPGKDIVWAQDAGTNMVFPSLLLPGTAREQLEGFAGVKSGERTAYWNQLRREAKASLDSRYYAVLKEVIPPAQREMLRRYVRQLVTRGYFPPLGDTQVELRSGIYKERTIASVHHGLAKLISSICDETVLDSYCYLCCYEAGSVLDRHVDRPQCAYNFSMVFDMDGPDGEPDPWPIYLELDGHPEAVLLSAGDGVLYQGTELYHWRDALPEGQRAIICFFHFVPEDFTGSLT